MEGRREGGREGEVGREEVRVEGKEGGAHNCSCISANFVLHDDIPMSA